MKDILIDLDGTIADYWSKTGKVNLKSFEKGLFINKQPVKAVLKAIREVFPESECSYTIVSHSPHQEANIEKSEWLLKYFNCNFKEIIYVKYPEESKEYYINKFIEDNNLDRKEVCLIDDDIQILRNVERECNIQVFHPSRILVMAQELEGE